MEWNISHYTAVIECDSGGLILHNSFMGAIAYIPDYLSKDILRFLNNGGTELDFNNRFFKELCDEGFFVPSNIDEQKLVSEILYKERELNFFYITILPHEDCNFRCTYCYEDFKHGKMNYEIINGIKAFIDHKTKEYRGLNVSWFGGEPLLAKDVIYELSASFIDSCECSGISYSSGISTNGYFLTPDVVDSLLQCKVTRFQVTLDGPEIIHDSMRKLAAGGKTYRRILNNLREMHRRKDDFSVRIRVNFNDISLPLMKQFFSEITCYLEGDTRFFMYFRPIGKWGSVNDSNLSVCDSSYARLAMVELIKEHMNFGFSDKIVKESLAPHGNVCYASKESHIVVGSNGTVYKCTIAFQDPRNHVGKITKDGELLIDQSRWNLWVKLDGIDISKCISCSFSPSCQSRKCPMIAMDFKKPVCPMTKLEYESMVKLIVSNKRSN